MDLIHILILLFILYPLLQKLLGGGTEKGKNQRPHRTPTGQHREPWQKAPDTEKSSDNWDDALRELESIFTGETTRKTPETDYDFRPEPVKKPEPVRDSGPVRRSQPAPASESPQLRRQRELQERFEKVQRKDSILDEIADEDNPIYQSFDEAAIVEDEEGDYSGQTRSFLGLDNIRELQRHLMLKEILDKPLSKRRRNRDLPF